MESGKIINLIQSKTGVSPQLESLTLVLRKLSLWTLAILVISGIAAAGIFYYMKVRVEQLMEKQQQLVQIITQSTTTEGLLGSVRQRVALTNKIIGVQQPVGKVFDMLSTFVSPDQISGLSLDEKNNVSLMIHAQSIPEVVSITDALVKQTLVNRVRTPQLVFLSFGERGGVEVGLSFIAVF